MDQTQRTAEIRITIPPLLEAVKDARDLVAKAWALWGLGDDYFARLVASELVTNSVRASLRYEMQEDIEVCVRLTEGRAQIEVWDHVPAPAIVVLAGDDDESGRGTQIVLAMCARWNTEWVYDQHRKYVRAELVPA
ncbi:ATP-binding protein [Actinomadura sp. NPDC048021]|uniref:ATP-binding protein n=1 Tax=Actinomadura sp. NPDC048021 TaxID=3155385 RepID=UPI0033C07DE8